MPFLHRPFKIPLQAFRLPAQLPFETVLNLHYWRKDAVNKTDIIMYLKKSSIGVTTVYLLSNEQKKGSIINVGV
jgi:hypothetical protein